VPVYRVFEFFFLDIAGSAAGQTLQLCVAPPFVAGGQQPFVMPSHIPFLQPPIPAIRPIPVPGSNTLFNTKFP
jgi:hypothetical protein